MLFLVFEVFHIHQSIRNNDGDTPLDLALINGHVAVIKYLIEQCNNKNIQNNKGWTPLHYASYYGFTDIVKYLIKNGSDPSIKDEKEKTPLDYAIEKD